jgi:pimeloyl-ACP methyl ester carboxylesterase
VQTTEITFRSDGSLVHGIVRLPDAGAPPFATIVTAPGWLGLARSPWNDRVHEAFTAAGYAVLAFDYRGYGDSEGEPGWIHPDRQLADIAAAVTVVELRSELDASRIGYFGHGGTGGGNAIIAAATDRRIRAVVAMEAISDGPSWLQAMRTTWDWQAFVERVAQNRRRRVLTGEGERVDPRAELMVASPDRKAEIERTPVDDRVGASFHLASAEKLLRYRPIDFVGRISPRPLLLTTVVDGVVVPEVHARRLYEAAGPPKRLVRQRGTRSYTQYRDNHALLMAEFTAWFDRYLQ